MFTFVECLNFDKNFDRHSSELIFFWSSPKYYKIKKKMAYILVAKPFSYCHRKLGINFCVFMTSDFWYFS